MGKKIFTSILALSLCHSSASAIGYCPKSKLFETSTFDLDPALTQVYEDNYNSNVDSILLCELPDRKELRNAEIFFDSKIQPILEAKTDLKKSERSKNESLKQDVVLISASFISMLLLAKNGYEKALSKELSFFTSQLLKINSDLSARKKLSEENKRYILEELFNYLTEVNASHFKNFSAAEKQRTLKFIENMSREVLKNDYSNEFNTIFKNYTEKQAPLTYIITVFTLMILNFAILIDVNDLMPTSDWVVNLSINQKPFLTVAKIFGGSALSFFIGFKLSKTAITQFLKPMKKDPTRIHEAAKKSCLIYLDETSR